MTASVRRPKGGPEPARPPPLKSATEGEREGTAFPHLLFSASVIPPPGFKCSHDHVISVRSGDVCNLKQVTSSNSIMSSYVMAA